jgi:hypothetical protein
LRGKAVKFKGYNAKRDANEGDIVKALRKFGVSVYLLDQPLDLLCGFGGITRLAEVKDTRNKRGDPKAYTSVQLDFLETWKGGHTLLVTVDDAREFALQIRADALKARAA